MQHIKQQILSQIKDKEARIYLVQQLFKPQILTNLPRNTIHSSFLIKDHGLASSSSILLTSLQQKQSKLHQKTSIKSIIKRIEQLIVVNGFWKNNEEINQLKKKIDTLKRENKIIKEKLAESRITQNNKNLRQIQNKTKKQSIELIILSETSSVDDYLNYEEQIKETSQRLLHEKQKETFISLVKLPLQQKQKLLEHTKTQYQSILRQISTMEKVVENMQKFHPEEASLKLQIQQLQTQINKKSMILAADCRLDIEIQELKTKISQIQKQKSIAKRKQQPKTALIQDKASLKFLQRKSVLQNRIFEFEQFIKEEQNQKQLLVNQIKSFNEQFEKQRKQNEILLNKIRQNFYQYPQLIDEIIKINNQDKNKISFLLNKLGFEL